MITASKRDLNTEFEDSDSRKYAYEFDYILRDYMVQTFSPFFKGGRALEMGCYKGEFTKRLIKHFAHVTVVEGSSELIVEAKKNVGESATFIHSLFDVATFEDKFDAIFLMHTLEHLDDPVGVLKRVDNWLSPDGLLYLVTPNANAPSRQIAVKMGLISHNAAVTEGEATHGHRSTYSLDTLERDVRLSGLEVVHRGGVFFKPLANFQFDKLIASGFLGKDYLDGCYQLGMSYPDLCASIYLLCRRSQRKT
ncbi:MAG: class I SAM-dependent methyltransferase [Betaproteobacteria bacterium]|jgi:2-polyprenyl-3-methyl-5-hydroxy-6-metoxy-1,4-benzoquinol methylase